MKLKKNCVALALTSALIASSNAAIVVTDSATSSTIASNGTGFANMIDGKLSTTGANHAGGTYEALSEANKLSLVSNNGYGFVGAGGGQYISNNANGTYTFNFTDATVGEILLWNYSQNADRGLDSISMVEIMTDGVNWVDLSLTKTLLDAGTANFQAQVLDLGGAFTGVDGIRLTGAQASTGGGEFAGGFDEVAFSSVSAVPEPSSTALLGLGGLALILRRRK